MTSKAGDAIEIQKLKSQVRSLARGNAVDLMELGKTIYDRFKAGEEVEGVGKGDSARQSRTVRRAWKTMRRRSPGSKARLNAETAERWLQETCRSVLTVERRSMRLYMMRDETEAEFEEDYADIVREKAASAAETVAEKADEAAQKAGDMAEKAAQKTRRYGG